jgi:hypothetical protein
MTVELKNEMERKRETEIKEDKDGRAVVRNILTRGRGRKKEEWKVARMDRRKKTPWPESASELYRPRKKVKKNQWQKYQKDRKERR